MGRQLTVPASVQVRKVIAGALERIKEMGIASDGRAVVLHDVDITDNHEMSDWVLRVVGIQEATCASIESLDQAEKA